MDDAIAQSQSPQAAIPPLRGKHVLLPWVFLAGATWLFFVFSISPQWMLNPEYRYGWAVPFLCLTLCWDRWQTRGATAPARGVFWAITVGAVLCIAILAGILIREANPDWLFPTWGIAFSTMGLLLLEAFAAGGIPWARLFTPPILFLLTALPWPFFLEHRVVQDLTGFVTAMATEILVTFGIPALQHGNVIEVSTGLVGIDEACSGIRSLQAVVMISLFCGAKFRLGFLRSAVLMLAGAFLACLCNVARSSTLAVVAATKGMTALASWHDPLGVAILLVCFSGVWLGAMLLSRTGHLSRREEASESLPTIPNPLPVAAVACLIAWFPLTWIATQFWYRAHEHSTDAGAHWEIDWPRNNPSFISHEIPKYTFNLLLYDEGYEAGWDEADHSHWEAAYFRWRPGLRAAQSLRDHVPQTCLPGSGMSLMSAPSRTNLNIHGMAFPVERYVADDRGRTLYIYRCISSDFAETTDGSSIDWSRASRMRRVWEGKRQRSDQRIIEISAAGYGSQQAADQALERELDSLIRT